LRERERQRESLPFSFLSSSFPFSSPPILLISTRCASSPPFPHHRHPNSNSK
jgi:hypothetical protein